MKISCTPISAEAAFSRGEMDQVRYFELIAGGGADGTDIMDSGCYPWFWQNVERDKKTLSERLKACGLTVAAYATGNHFAVREPEEFQKQVEIVTRAIHEAAEIGAPVLRIFGGYHKDLVPAHDMDYAEGLQLIVKGIEAVLPEARKCGVSLAIENHGRLPGLSGELLYIMKQFETPELGICLDIGNFYGASMNETEDAVRAYERLKKYVKHVHYKDLKMAPYGAPKRVVPCICGKGDGIVPLRQMAYLLEENRFAGWCSLEYEAPALDGITASLQYMNSLKQSAALLYPGEKK